MLSKRIHSVLATAVLLFTLATDHSVTFGVDWRVGVAKSDITPREPIRLSGYANRSQPFKSVADPLHARAMVILETEKETRNAVVIVSVDSIAVTAPMTIEVAKWTEEKFGVPRSQLVLCSSHSHAAPHIHGGLNNLFTTPLAEEEKQKIQSYTSEMIVGIKRSIEAAFASMKPAGLSIATTTAGFAMQRRAIRSGKWAGFGETADGAVDRRVRVLQCHDRDGKSSVPPTCMHATARHSAMTSIKSLVTGPDYLPTDSSSFILAPCFFQ